MFSINVFYQILHEQLISKIKGYSFSFPFGSTDPNEIIFINLADCYKLHTFQKYSPLIFFYDQEPFYYDNFWLLHKFSRDGKLLDALLAPYSDTKITLNFLLHDVDYFRHHLIIVANSEKSEEVEYHLKSFQYFNWYFFSHGFIALDWYRNLKYYKSEPKFNKVFICFNNLVTGNRNYRLNLVARILDKKLESSGYISLNSKNLKINIKKEIFDKNFLTLDSKKLIYNHLYLKDINLSIDKNEIDGSLSANDDVTVLTSGFIHLVTETIYYEKKLHLTEKIFKPIVSRRPFLLVAAQGNLKYLKSYGFKTFNHWIDESYDNEPDPNKRIIMIINELEKLCQLSHDDLNKMYQEMEYILEYNFNHFFGNFKSIIVDELVDNFRKILIQYNAGKDKSFIENYVDCSEINFEEIKTLLKS